jgi:hypothetical protein
VDVLPSRSAVTWALLANEPVSISSLSLRRTQHRPSRGRIDIEPELGKHAQR